MSDEQQSNLRDAFFVLIAKIQESPLWSVDTFFPIVTGG